MLDDLKMIASSFGDHVLVIDDDPESLGSASRIFMKERIKASCVRSGEEALRFLDSANSPDLILLDLHMPGMDGFSVLDEIRKRPALADVPVIFLTADDEPDAEVRGLDAGAMDFIKKPFVPKVLITRVRHAIDLSRLKNDLAGQVAEKTRSVVEHQEKLRSLSIGIVMALAGAIDAKDSYTRGHSVRVAEYSREIAIRSGLDSERVETIYMMGLLHDVGKIGIPDSILTKPARLTDEEFAVIRTHPVKGYEILKPIEELPELSVGARWHHERYDGRGYPDGLSGTSIPEEARIISVADAYDAMSSSRSYREGLSQAHIRSEIEKGRGTQFDPVFSDIMLQMIDADTGFEMQDSRNS